MVCERLLGKITQMVRVACFIIGCNLFVFYVLTSKALPDGSTLLLCFDFHGHPATILIVQVHLLILHIHMNIFMTLSSLIIVENVQSNVEDQAKVIDHSNER